MGNEIERKYLVDPLWTPRGPGREIVQGYLNSDKERTVRVRIDANNAFLAVKGLTRGVSRLEFEYPVPLVDARVMLRDLCERPIIEKTRHTEEYRGLLWEIDVFRGANAGLVVAEVELESAGQRVELPPWARAEVSHDPRYFNSSLTVHPFSRWGREID